MSNYTGHIIEDAPGEYRVWAEGERNGPSLPYIGPVAKIYADKDLANFVYIKTDDFEGVAMINREALPKLIEALQRLEAHLQVEMAS